MKQNKGILSIIGLLSLFLMLTAFAGTTDGDTGLINWTSLEKVEKFSKKKKKKKKVIISFHTSWCGWCKKMDASTFSDPKVADYVNENYYMISMDAESKDEITFKGETYKFVEQGRRGYNEFAANVLQGRMSYPSTVWLSEDLELIQPVPGYLDPQKFMMIASYFGGDFHQTTPWADYEKSYQKSLEDDESL